MYKGFGRKLSRCFLCSVWLIFIPVCTVFFNTATGSEAEYFKSIIKTHPDFPEAGIQFRDVLPLFRDPEAHHRMIDALVKRYKDREIDCIGALDARGFLIGSTLAYLMKKPLVVFRKKGKLPGETFRQSYNLEYGQAELEVKKGDISQGSSVLLVDDLLATGGTAAAACELVRQSGASVFELAVIVGKPEDVPTLNGVEVLQGMRVSVYYLCTYAKSNLLREF